MTKSQCNSHIAACNEAIQADRRRITELEEKIVLYERMCWKVECGQENMGSFCACHSRKINNIKMYFPLVNYTEFYVGDMTEYLQGTEYNRVIGKFESAKETLNKKKQAAIREIDILNADIRAKQNRIYQLEDEIREIERREMERREMERREMERRAMEAEKRRQLCKK